MSRRRQRSLQRRRIAITVVAAATETSGKLSAHVANRRNVTPARTDNISSISSLCRMYIAGVTVLSLSLCVVWIGALQCYFSFRFSYCLTVIHQYRHVATIIMKKRSEETQTLRAGCSKAEPKTFALPQTPFPGARDGQNLISWRWSLPLPKNPVWRGSMHAISSYRGNRPTHKHTDRTDYNTLRRSLTQCRNFLAIRTELRRHHKLISSDTFI